MNNFYRVMELLENPDFAFSEMVYEVARVNPKAVVAAVERLHAKKTKKEEKTARDRNENWQNKCRELMRSGDKLQAIKTCREATGLGLGEAKEAVEALEL